MAVAVAASIGLIPGCGPQIIAFTAYVEGIFSFPALVANAISQDGDALFPLLVRHRTASLWATIHTLLPGLICGMILLCLELTFHEAYISSHAFFKNITSSGVSTLMWMWGSSTSKRENLIRSLSDELGSASLMAAIPLQSNITG